MCVALERGELVPKLFGKVRAEATLLGEGLRKPGAHGLLTGMSKGRIAYVMRNTSGLNDVWQILRLGTGHVTGFFEPVAYSHSE
ncbi:hypothetical protein GCM10022290_36940 [Sagittula marina]